MAIENGPFGGVTLTGDDAKAFLRQIAEQGEAYKIDVSSVRQLAETGAIRVSWGTDNESE